MAKVKSARPDLLEAIIARQDARIEALLAQGANANIADSAGWRGLHFAAQNDNVALIQTLLRAGAEIDAKDSNGNTALSNAVFSYRGDPDCILMLLTAGADRDLANHHGVSPLSLAESIANNDVRKWL